MGANYTTDKGYEVNSGSTWGTNSAEYNSYNTCPNYGDYQQDRASRCMICKSGDNIYQNYAIPPQYQPYGNCQQYMPPMVADHGKNIELDDGRKICPDCYTSSIMSEEELKPIIDGVRKFFEDKKLKVKKSTPVFLVGKADIVRILIEGFQLDGAPPVDPSNPSTIAHDAVTTRNKWEISNVISCSQRGRSIKVTKGFTTTSNKKTSILILYGMPRFYTGRVLAHEMMHVWLISQGLGDNLSYDVAEGLCEVMSRMWVEEQCRDHSTRLKNLAISEIESGDAYRKAAAAVKKNGLSNTLKFVSKYKKLPI